MIEESRSDRANGCAHQMPFGAAVLEDGSVRFAFLAPQAQHVQLSLQGQPELPMLSKADGWHELITTVASAGSLYQFVLPDGLRVADPVSRFQPEDVEGYSQVIDPTKFVWHDVGWRGRPWNDTVLYELHIGTFTPEGTFTAAIEKLDHLQELGVTVIEVMSIAGMPGKWGWSYDGVLLYAPHAEYGTPDDMRAFVDAAHSRGLAVILDVVYNHFGPEGNYISKYFPQMCSTHHETPWGKALNFDEAGSRNVRDFIIHNALYWVEEFHVDGLRLDAAHTLIDDSPVHILDELHDRVQGLKTQRPVHLILENELIVANKVARDHKGEVKTYAAQWNYDISHLLAVSYADLSLEGTREETENIALALSQGFAIPLHKSGQLPGHMSPPTAFVAFMQTHDLVGNRIFGDRVSASASEKVLRVISALYLLAPQIPMLFMGEEWNATTPFPFFCDFHGETAKNIHQSRHEELAKLKPPPTEDEIKRAPDPLAESTFHSARLDWSEPEQPAQKAYLERYKALIAKRREVIVPLLNGLTECCGTCEVLAPGAFYLAWNVCGDAKLHLSANVCKEVRSGFPAVKGDVFWHEGTEDIEGQLGPFSLRWSLEK